MRPIPRLALRLFLVPAICFGGQAEGAAAGRDALRMNTTAPISLTRAAWMWSSVPLGQDNLVSSHALVEWYNPRGVKERDLNPDLQVYEGSDNEHQVLELRVKPPTGEVDLSAEDWAGITYPLSTVGQDLTKIQFIELWINDFTPDHPATRGTLRINLGRVSEDAFWDTRNAPNARYDTEDKNRDGRLDGGTGEFAEDTGLDGLFDEQEPGYDPSTNPDPNGDDYAYTLDSGDYSHINNFERNGNDNPNARPDTEDLNWNGILDTDNNYFEAAIDLSDTHYVAIDVSQFYAGDPDVKPDNGWRLFRIPISDSTFTRFGFASWDNVQAIRLWVDGVAEPLRFQIGGIFLRGDAASEVTPNVVLYQNYPNPFNPRTAIPTISPRTGRSDLPYTT